MTAGIWLVQLPTELPGQVRFEGADSVLVWAGSSADALALAMSQFPGASLAFWDHAVVTEFDTGAADLLGWSLRVSISPATFTTDPTPSSPTYGAGEVVCDVTVTADDSFYTQATNVVTIGGVVALDTATLTIGSTTYTFTASSPVNPNDVFFTTEVDAATNLIAAIEGTGTPGTDYGVGTEPNTEATAVTGGSGVVDLTAIPLGTLGNAVAISDSDVTDITLSHAATFSGGLDISLDTLGAKMATALNALTGVLVPFSNSPPIAYAAYNSGSHTLTAAGTADGLGDHALLVQVLPPASEATQEGATPQPVPGFIGVITDKGASDAALTVVLTVANAKPLVVLVASASQPGW